MEVDDATKPFVEQGRFLTALNYEHLPNSRGLDASQRAATMVGTWVTEHGIVYNEAKFRELGIPKPNRVTDLLDPRLQRRVAFPDINVGFVVNGIAAFTLEAGLRASSRTCLAAFTACTWSLSGAHAPNL